VFFEPGSIVIVRHFNSALSASKLEAIYGFHSKERILGFYDTQNSSYLVQESKISLGKILISSEFNLIPTTFSISNNRNFSSRYDGKSPSSVSANTWFSTSLACSAREATSNTRKSLRYTKSVDTSSYHRLRSSNFTRIVAQVPDLDYLHDSSLSKEMQVNLIPWDGMMIWSSTKPAHLIYLITRRIANFLNSFF